MTAKEASRLFGIMGAAGSDLRDATEGLVTFNQRVEDALSGTGEISKQLFKDLGVSAKEFAGLNPSEQFFKLADAIKQVDDPGKRVQLLMKAFGEDTGKNLIRVLAKSKEELDQLGDAFEQSEADFVAAQEAASAYKLAVASIQNIWRQIAIALAPTIKLIADHVTNLARPIANFIRDNKQVITAAIGAITRFWPF